MKVFIKKTRFNFRDYANDLTHFRGKVSCVSFYFYEKGIELMNLA